MAETKTASPNLRRIFLAAIPLALLLLVLPSWLKATHQPTPMWTEYLPDIFLGIVFGFFVLLYPMPRFSPLIRRVMITVFFSLSAVQLFRFILKGV